MYMRQYDIELRNGSTENGTVRNGINLVQMK